MSSGAKIPLERADWIAARCVRALAPITQEVHVVGSVRRRKAEVGDVELVVVPRMMTVGFLGEEAPDIEVIHEVARTWASDGRLHRAGQRQVAVVLYAAVEVTVELYLVHPPAQLGSILAIRTGPADLGQHVMMCLQRRGYRHVEGHVERDGRLVPTPTEEDFFRLAGLACLAPHQRHTPEAFRVVR